MVRISVCCGRVGGATYSCGYFQPTENAHDGPNLSDRAGSARPAGGFRNSRFGTRLSVGVVDIEQLYDRHHRQTARVRAVRRDSDAARGLGDGGSIVALSAAEASLAFAQG